jgi:hypothetical protein
MSAPVFIPIAFALICVVGVWNSTGGVGGNNGPVVRSPISCGGEAYSCLMPLTLRIAVINPGNQPSCITNLRDRCADNWNSHSDSAIWDHYKIPFTAIVVALFREKLNCIGILLPIADAYTYIERWRFSDVRNCQGVIDSYGRIFPYRFGVATNPWPLIGFHNFQLILHGLDLLGGPSRESVGARGLLVDRIIDFPHFVQLFAESTPTQTSENNSQKNKKYRDAIQRGIYFLISVLMDCLSILSITKGLNRGGYSGAGIVILGLPLLAIGVCCFLYGFLNLTFP